MVNTDKLLSTMTAHAEQLGIDAGYNGSHNDGGKQDLLDQIDAYKAALAGEIPDGWKEEYRELTKKDDPEYAEYLRLKKKFD